MRAALVVSTCEMCRRGLYSPPGSTSEAARTSECGPGFYSMQSEENPDADGVTSNMCIQCPPNSDAAVGSNNRTDCACNAGFAGSNGGVCTQCVLGKYSIGIGNAACTACAKDTFFTDPGATTVCQACPANSNAPPASHKATDCKCNSGFQGNDGEPCIPCVIGQMPLNRWDAKCACPSGKFASLAISQPLPTGMFGDSVFYELLHN